MAHKKSILLVDDEKAIRLPIKLNLKKKGYKVFELENGTKAVKLAKKKKIDIILLDIMMPVMNGFETIKVLKQEEETKDIPIIVLSAISDSGAIADAIRLGADNYFVKPFSMKDLDEIDKILDKKEESKAELN